MICLRAVPDKWVIEGKERRWICVDQGWSAPLLHTQLGDEELHVLIASCALRPVVSKTNRSRCEKYPQYARSSFSMTSMSAASDLAAPRHSARVVMARKPASPQLFLWLTISGSQFPASKIKRCGATRKLQVVDFARDESVCGQVHQQVMTRTPHPCVNIFTALCATHRLRGLETFGCTPKWQNQQSEHRVSAIRRGICRAKAVRRRPATDNPSPNLVHRERKGSWMPRMARTCTYARTSERANPCARQ